MDDSSPVHFKPNEKKALAALLERVKKPSNGPKTVRTSTATSSSNGGNFDHPEFISPEDYVHRGKSMGTLDTWDNVMLSVKVGGTMKTITINDPFFLVSAISNFYSIPR